MTHLRRAVALLLSAMLLLSLAACDKAPIDAPIVESGEGYAVYAGLWCTNDLSWQMGGLTLEIAVTNNEMSLLLQNTEGAPTCSVAQIKQTVPVSNINEDVLSFVFADDGWGNSGTVELTFIKNSILVDIKDMQHGDSAWGFFESTYKLAQNDDAYKLLQESDEDTPSDPSDAASPDDGFNNDYPYNDNDGDNYIPEVDDTPTYDMSKASGILASMGMTEEQFKASCTPICGNVLAGVKHIDKYFKYYGEQYYQENPDAGELQFHASLWKDDDDSYPQNKYTTFENYMYHLVYKKKGYEIITDYTEELFEKMREYPNEYIGQGFLFLDAWDLYSEHYNFFEVSIEDCRDDIHNPNLLFSKYEYYLYAVFTGSNGEKLTFDLIAVEKLETE